MILALWSSSSIAAHCAFCFLSVFMMRGLCNDHTYHSATEFAVSYKEGHDKLLTLHWLPKFHKRPYKARFIANISSCTTIELSKLLTACLTAISKHVINYCDERSGKNLFGPLKLRMKF